MAKNLVIVESPKTIEGYLKDFLVKSSIGHIRDLPKKEVWELILKMVLFQIMKFRKIRNMLSELKKV